MSTQALAGATTGIPAGELALAQRVRQIQALVEQTRLTSTSDSVAPSSSFAATLRTASATGSANTNHLYGYQAGATLPASGQYSGVGIGAGAAGSGSIGYDSLIDQAAGRYGLDPAVLHGLIQQESGFDPGATSGAGAVGLTQLMPATAASLGVTDPRDPAQSIEGGARYLSQMMARFGGDTTKALAAYNAGPGAVERYGGVPPYAETQGYVAKVLAYANAYRQSPAGAAATGGIE